MTGSGIDPRLAGALAVQLQRWRATLATGATRVGWKLGVGDLRADAEVAFELGRDVDPGADPGADPAAAAGAIAGVGVALELVDLAGSGDGPQAVVAANIFHRAVAFGPFHPPPLPPGVQGRLLVNDRVVEAAPGPGRPTW